MTKQPTLTKRALAYIEQQGTARSDQIADAIGSDGNSVCSLLRPHVTSGKLIVCQVTSAAGRKQNEYRIGSGIVPKTQHPEIKQSRPPQREVGKNTRSAPSVLLHDSTAEGHAVAPKAPRPTNTASARNEISLSIDDEGRLTMNLNDGQSSPFVFSAAETMALGDFLGCTEQLWRP